MSIHQAAEVHPLALVGDAVTVWGGTRIGPRAIIGDNITIGRNCEVDCVIGNGSVVQAGCLLYHGVKIGDNCFIGPGVITTNDIRPRAGGGDWYHRFRETHIQDGASIGAGAVIVCGITIGEGAEIGAGSVVTKDVKPHHLVRGNPAQHIRNIEGEVS